MYLICSPASKGTKSNGLYPNFSIVSSQIFWYPNPGCILASSSKFIDATSSAMKPYPFCLNAVVSVDLPAPLSPVNIQPLSFIKTAPPCIATIFFWRSINPKTVPNIYILTIYGSAFSYTSTSILSPSYTRYIATFSALNHISLYVKLLSFPFFIVSFISLETVLYFIVASIFFLLGLFITVNSGIYISDSRFNPYTL